jgi:hypothetical protein
MITPGWLPNYRARGARKLAYLRKRKKAKRAWTPLTDEERELLAAATCSGELPVARVHVKSPSAAGLAASFVAWLGAQMRSARPRLIPASAAFAGLLAMIAMTNYLSHAGKLKAQHGRATQTAYSWQWHTVELSSR